MVPFNVGEPRPAERTPRPARVRQLLFRARPDARARPLPAAGRSRTRRRRAGRRHLPCVLADALRAARPTVLGRTMRVNDRQLTIVGVAPERFQGTVHDAQPSTSGCRRRWRRRCWPGRASSRIAVSAATSSLGRLAPHATRGAGADRARRRDAPAGARLIRKPTRRLQGEVLPFWQAPRGPQRMLVGALADPAGRSCCCCCSRSAATPRT